MYIYAIFAQDAVMTELTVTDARTRLAAVVDEARTCLLYTSPSPRD